MFLSLFAFIGGCTRCGGRNLQNNAQQFYYFFWLSGWQPCWLSNIPSSIREPAAAGQCAWVSRQPAGIQAPTLLLLVLLYVCKVRLSAAMSYSRSYFCLTIHSLLYSSQHISQHIVYYLRVFNNTLCIVRYLLCYRLCSVCV